jgi:hypothetical protein
MPWARFSNTVTTLEERESWRLLDTELAGKRRKGYLKRLYEHANGLRTSRQRASILTRGTLPGDRP